MDFNSFQICAEVGRKISFVVESKLRVKPFLRWIGGKRLLVTKLSEYLPNNAHDKIYYEPFLGAASMFFSIQPKLSILSDLNHHLINCYEFIKKDYKNVASYVNRHSLLNCERYYYKIRNKYNESNYDAAQAARFIYLNHTCYNGIFRVNKLGHFNVPFGDKKYPKIPTVNDLGLVSKVLRNSLLISLDYESVLKNAQKGDFVYLDPPYPPLNGTSYFTHYTQDRFNASNQERLAGVVRKLDRKGCLIMMSNADTAFIRTLYKGYNIYELLVTRYVTCKNIKHRVGELVITNYDKRY